MEKEKYTYQLTQFGKRLKQLRKYKNLTQLDLEVATGIYGADISKIENGLKNLEFITIAKFADALGVEIFELFIYEGALPTTNKKTPGNKISIKKSKTLIKKRNIK